MKDAFAILILFLSFSCITQTSQEEEKENTAFVFLEERITSWIENGYYDGSAICIRKDNKSFFESYYGGFTDTTTLHVASAGKWVASATIAALVDQGKMSWNDPVNKYLPEFKDIKGEATLAQLLSHTSGYPDYQPVGKRRDDYQTLEEAVSHIIELPADALPGTLFKYGGLAMQVAGRMAEIATGRDWESLFQEYIAAPLEISFTRFTPVSQEPGFNPLLGGGLKTCLRDYMNFLEMIFNRGTYKGKQILSADAISYMEADHLVNALLKEGEYVENARQHTHHGVYGLGLWREETEKNGETVLVSSPGWAGAYPWIDRKNNIYGFFLAKVNVEEAHSNGFSSFYGSSVIPLIVRDQLHQMKYPARLNKRKVNIDGATLYCEELGDGDPLILIHGHSLNHRMWDLQFYEFARQYRVIRYDLRGYGYSSHQQEGEQFTHVEDLIKLMDALEIDKAHIVGLSLGGYIGTDMLGWFPERVLTATLASGNLRKLPKPSFPMNEEETNKREKEIERLKRQGVDSMKQEWLNGLVSSGGSRKEEIRVPLWNMIAQWDAWQPLHKEARVIAGEDAFICLKEKIPEIPVLILEGNSSGNPSDNSPELLDYLPNGEIRILPDCGHMMNMEQPELFNHTVLEFISATIR